MGQEVEACRSSVGGEGGTVFSWPGVCVCVALLQEGSRDLGTIFPFVTTGAQATPCRKACGILVPPPGMEPAPVAVEAQSPNH